MSTVEVKPITSFSSTSGVYALVDPRTNRVMYVGQSVDIDFRYRQHVNPNNYDTNREKRQWIWGLKAVGLVPKLIVIAECEWPASDDVEQQYIKLYKSNGQCELNLAAGGKYSRAVSKGGNSHRDDWFQLGLKIRFINRLIWEVVQDLGHIDGAKSMDLMLSVRNRLSIVMSRLEDRLVSMHPDWSDITKVFYGNDE